MGLGSFVKRAVKKVTKGVGRIFKRVGKVVKRVLSNKFVRIAAIAAAVYFGGQALLSKFGTAGASGGNVAAQTLSGELVVNGGQVAGAQGAAVQGAAGAFSPAAAEQVTAETLLNAAGNAGGASAANAAAANAAPSIAGELAAKNFSPAVLSEGSKVGAETLLNAEKAGLLQRVGDGLGRAANAAGDVAGKFIPKTDTGKLVAGLMVGNAVNGYYQGKALEAEQDRLDQQNAEWDALYKSGEASNFDFRLGPYQTEANRRMNERSRQNQDRFRFETGYA